MPNLNTVLRPTRARVVYSALLVFSAVAFDATSGSISVSSSGTNVTYACFDLCTRPKVCSNNTTKECTTDEACDDGTCELNPICRTPMLWAVAMPCGYEVCDEFATLTFSDYEYPPNEPETVEYVEDYSTMGWVCNVLLDGGVLIDLTQQCVAVFQQNCPNDGCRSLPPDVTATLTFEVCHCIVSVSSIDPPCRIGGDFFINHVGLGGLVTFVDDLTNDPPFDTILLDYGSTFTLPPGACCDRRIVDPLLRCRDGVPESQCIIDDPTQVSWTEETLCQDLDPACAEHTGACCDRRIADPLLRCRDGVPESQCIIDDPTQVSWTKATLCQDLDPACTEHTGACCDRRIADPLLRCRDDVPESGCVIDDPDQVSWYKFTRCADLPEPCLEHTGACCDEDPFGTCQDNVPASQCNCTKCLFYQDTPCSEIECVHNSIPTVSEWGLVVMTLLLLTGAKVYFGRRSEMGSP